MHDWHLSEMKADKYERECELDREMEIAARIGNHLSPAI
jgi:hypothetical protein